MDTPQLLFIFRLLFFSIIQRFRSVRLPNDFENKGEGDSFGAAPLSLFDWDPRGPRPFNRTFYIATPRGVNEPKDSDWNFYFQHNN